MKTLRVQKSVRHCALCSSQLELVSSRSAVVAEVHLLAEVQCKNGPSIAAVHHTGSARFVAAQDLAKAEEAGKRPVMEALTGPVPVFARNKSGGHGTRTRNRQSRHLISNQNAIAENPEKTALSEDGAALALQCDDERLAAVCEVWEVIPDSMKTAISELIKPYHHSNDDSHPSIVETLRRSKPR